MAFRMSALKLSVEYSDQNIQLIF